jgi:hypothetical protein
MLPSFLEADCDKLKSLFEINRDRELRQVASSDCKRFALMEANGVGHAQAYALKL